MVVRVMGVGGPVASDAPRGCDDGGSVRRGALGVLLQVVVVVVIRLFVVGAGGDGGHGAILGDDIGAHPALCPGHTLGSLSVLPAGWDITLVYHCTAPWEATLATTCARFTHLMSLAMSSSLSLLLRSTNHMQRMRRKTKPNTEPRVAPTITPALAAKGGNHGRHASTKASCAQTVHMIPEWSSVATGDVVAYR